MRRRREAPRALRTAISLLRETARKHKTGDIGAGDEKNESDNGHEDVERLIELTAQFGHSRRGGRG